MVATTQPNVVHVAKAGDLRSAHRRYREGGDEFFFAEKLGVQGMLRVAEELGGLTAVNCCTDEAYEEQLSPTLRAVGLGCKASDDPEGALLGWLAQQGPSKMIARSPFVRALAWAKENRVDTLPVVADTFFGEVRTGPLFKRLRAEAGRWKYRRIIGNALRGVNPRWASNRNVDASWELVKLGIPPEAVVPHEHAAAVTPEMGKPRVYPAGHRWELVYAGRVFESKGVGDAIEAVRRLRSAGRDVRLTVIGGGVVEPFKQQAKDAGLGADCVDFAGRLPHAETLRRVGEAGALVVPSWPEYAEGLPNVIYEALCVRTPVIASDHPAWRTRLHADEHYISFRGCDASSLAEAIERLMSDASRWQRLSDASVATWEHLRCPVEIHELFVRWGRDEQRDREWLGERSLASGLYGRGHGG